MKLIHTADWHLGKQLYGKSLLEDQRWFLNGFFLPLLEREKPDAVLLGGDIFDRQVPPVEAVSLLDGFLQGMHAMKIPLIAVSGNHDSARRLSLGAALLRESGVVLATRPEDLFTPYRVETAEGPLCCWTLPYCEPGEARALLGDESLHSMDAAFRALLQRVEPEPGARNVLVTHCFAAGGQVGASENPAFVGGSAQVGTDLFEKFDYTALGHLHGPQKAGKGRYSGSPLCYSFDEAHQKKGVTLVELQGEQVETTLLPVCPPRAVRVVSGLFEDLLAAAKAAPSKDYLFAELADTRPVYLPVDQLKPYYENLLGLSSKWLLSRGEARDSALREELRGRADDMTVVSEFLRQICGAEADDGDRALLLELLKDQKEAVE